MTPAAFRDLLAKLSLSQMRAARLLGVDGRTVRYWIAGTYPIPDWAPRFLHLAWHLGIEHSENLLERLDR